MVKKILVAGASSGVGKTTITMGLIAALRRRGLQVQPFKAGPDYIDPTYHSLAAGAPCRNIDTWMVPPARALALFQRACRGADIAVIEGVMGVFDGFSYETEEGSSAQIAKLVDSPVLLALNVGQMARSAGALAFGYAGFDLDLNIAGFILNQCGSESHYQGVRQVVEHATGLPVFGWLPRDDKLHIPARHLGLVPTDERGELTSFIAYVAELIEQHIDLGRVLESAGSQSGAGSPDFPAVLFSERQEPSVSKPGLKIGVARDAAFSFYYEDNLDLLRENGADILFFSPQNDPDLPSDISGLYFGGGFPEMYAAQLAANDSLKAAIREAHAAGMPIYAECGGFMYLTEAIVDLDGQEHPMVGLVPGSSRMEPALISLGYREVQSPGGNFLLPEGVLIRGHEFHWSSWDRPDRLPPAWEIQPRREGEEVRPDGYADGNLVASYVHLHFAYTPEPAQNFVNACRSWKDGQAG